MREGERGKGRRERREGEREGREESRRRREGREGKREEERGVSLTDVSSPGRLLLVSHSVLMEE